MVRIVLNILNSSPFLQTVSGEVVVEYVDFRNTDSAMQVQHVLKCKFDCRPNQLGFRNDAGTDCAIFEALRPQISNMIHSYRRGMTLANHDYSWVEETKDKPFNIWKEEKVREYEITNEYKYVRPENKDKQ